ncbi:MAG: endopeptidase La [Clostridia bacterium]|nr:endopeptidase La [Clostridia bacterium]
MQNSEIMTLPVTVLRGMVAFPHNKVTFDAGRDVTINAVEAAMGKDKMIFLSPQINPEINEISKDSCSETGVIGKIIQIMRLPGGITRVIASGYTRARIINSRMEKYIEADIAAMPDFVSDARMHGALVRELKQRYQDFFSINNRMTSERFLRILAIDDGSVLSDTIAHQVEFPLEVKQRLLEASDVNERMELLIKCLANETDLLNLRLKIEKEVKKHIDKNQREYYLREQLKVIENELGDKDGSNAEMAEYRKKISALGLSPEYSEKLNKEVDRLKKCGFASAEGGVIRSYLDTVTELPWNKKTKENLSIENAKKILDRDHFGLEKVKKNVLLNLAVRNFNARGTNILCLVGPPGVGKTSIVKSIAEALGRNYVRISLGGIHDEADIRGHRKTYIGAMSGRIMSAVAQAGSKNALILLDEIDKVGTDYRGDPSAALLEVLDSEQNFAFRDHYIELPFDLSEVMFITTANTLDTISRPLLDRMDVIEVTGYTREEKLVIAKKYLFPKALEKTGLKGKRVTIASDAVYELIDYYTRESGVRNLERLLIKILSETAMLYLSEGKSTLKITKKLVHEFLGRRRYSFETKNSGDEVGLARGLAWTAVGGETLSVEVNVMKGTGKIELTGKLGDVMKESAMAAISFLRSAAERYGIADFYKTKDIHIHVPEGAVPKDGPSAGITMASAAFSALTGKKVRCDIAMTGEITLRGRVLPIGGLKEKSLAAHRAGINNIVIPYDNKKDLEDIPENIRAEMKFIPVKTMDEVLAAVIAK